MNTLSQRISFIGLSLIVGTVLSVLGLMFPISNEFYVARQVLVSFVKNLLPFIVLAHFFKAPLHRIRFDRKKISITDLVLMTAFAFLLCFSFNIVPNIISLLMGIDTNNSYTFNPMDYFSMAFFPAIIEELVFRQIIAGCFSEYSTRFAIFMSAGLFALSHKTLTSVLYAFLCGVILACLYIRTRSIIACSVVHFLCNALTITCWIFENPNLCYNFAITISFILLLIIFIVLKLKKVEIFPQETQKSSSLLFKTAFTNPIMIILLAIDIISIATMYL